VLTCLKDELELAEAEGRLAGVSHKSLPETRLDCGLATTIRDLTVYIGSTM